MSSQKFMALKCQGILEQNEDIIAAVVENMQIGRLEECMHHYSVLHSNLMSISEELDNYPGDSDPYGSISSFPDAIMSKNMLEDLKPSGTRPTLEKSPLPPPCLKCFAVKNDFYTCRVLLGHVEPSAKLTLSERDDFIRAAQVMEFHSRKRVKPQQAMNGMLSNRQDGSLYSNENLHEGAKKTYRRWTPYERHTLLMGVFIYGLRDLPSLAGMLDDRSTSQVKSYLAKSISDADIQQAVNGHLPPPPKDFYASSRHVALLQQKKLQSAGMMASTSQNGTSLDTLMPHAPSSTELSSDNDGFSSNFNNSSVNPVPIASKSLASTSTKNCNDWNALMKIAASSNEVIASPALLTDNAAPRNITNRPVFESADGQLGGGVSCLSATVAPFGSTSGIATARTMTNPGRLPDGGGLPGDMSAKDQYNMYNLSGTINDYEETTNFTPLETFPRFPSSNGGAPSLLLSNNNGHPLLLGAASGAPVGLSTVNVNLQSFPTPALDSTVPPGVVTSQASMSSLLSVQQLPALPSLSHLSVPPPLALHETHIGLPPSSSGPTNEGKADVGSPQDRYNYNQVVSAAPAPGPGPGFQSPSEVQEQILAPVSKSSSSARLSFPVSPSSNTGTSAVIPIALPPSNDLNANSDPLHDTADNAVIFVDSEFKGRNNVSKPSSRLFSNITDSTVLPASSINGSSSSKGGSEVQAVKKQRKAYKKREPVARGSYNKKNKNVDSSATNDNKLKSVSSGKTEENLTSKRKKASAVAPASPPTPALSLHPFSPNAFANQVYQPGEGFTLLQDEGFTNGSIGRDFNDDRSLLFQISDEMSFMAPGGNTFMGGFSNFASVVQSPTPASPPPNKNGTRKT